jgi:hypothetical protein
MSFAMGTVQSPIYWPSGALPPRRVLCDIQPRSVSGGVSLSGIERFKASDAGIWSLSFTIQIHSAEQVELVRGLAALSDGRNGVFSVCTADCGRGPGAGPNYQLPQNSLPHGLTAGGGRAYFSDGSGYRSRFYNVRLAASAPTRATTISIVIDTVPLVLPRPGHRFTIAGRLHEVRSVSEAVGAVANISIRPPLRQAVAAGADINFDEPTGLFRLSRDDGLSLSLDLLRFGVLNLEMGEAN